MLTNLAGVLHAAGLNVVEEPGWRTRGHGEMTSVQTIVCHHTAGPSTGELPSLGTVRDGRPGLSGPLAQLMLGRSGTWYVIAAGKCYHAGVVLRDSYANENAVGVEAEADGVSAWPTLQYHSYAKGCAALVKAYGLNITDVLGHKEVASPPGRKSDPNFSMGDFRSRVSDYLALEADVPIDDADVKKILTAPIDAKYTEASGDTVTVQDALGLAQRWALFGAQGAGRVEKAVAVLNAQLTKQGGEIVSVGNAVTALTAKVDALLARPAADVDEQALATALAAAGFSPEAIAAANLDAYRAALAQ
jgi:N-acetylmuramoyl-L-alanine amidase